MYLPGTSFLYMDRHIPLYFGFISGVWFTDFNCRKKTIALLGMCVKALEERQKDTALLLLTAQTVTETLGSLGIAVDISTAIWVCFTVSKIWAELNKPKMASLHVMIFFRTAEKLSSGEINLLEITMVKKPCYLIKLTAYWFVHGGDMLSLDTVTKRIVPISQ